MLLLKAQPQYEFVSLVGKMATFTNTTHGEFLPDFRGQPFIMMNNPGVNLD
jgi:hypothetical protein